MASHRRPSPATPRMSADRIIRCPGCGGDSVYGPANPHRPFCSERCRGADLGAWASEGYRVPARPSEDDSDETEPPSG